MSGEQEPRHPELDRAFWLAEINKGRYGGVTIGDVHRALYLMSNYAACLESHKRGLSQRIEVREAALKDVLSWFHVPTMEKGHSAWPLVRKIKNALADPFKARRRKKDK